MTRLKRHLLTTTSLLFLAAAIPAQATDGYFEVTTHPLESRFYPPWPFE